VEVVQISRSFEEAENYKNNRYKNFIIEQSQKKQQLLQHQQNIKTDRMKQWQELQKQQAKPNERREERQQEKEPVKQEAQNI
jgi:hypothetical protein